MATPVLAGGEHGSRAARHSGWREGSRRELVLFRDLSGRIGLVGLHCPHRGSSLEYGEIESHGIRCPYHAWLFDVAGNCLEQPAEPKDSQFYKKVKHLSYPVRQQ